MPISKFAYRRRVQFAETDASGLVHFTQFFRYAEEAEHAMWRSAGLSVTRAGAIAWPRVAAAFEYMKPLHVEDEFDVHVRVAAKSSKTFRYHAVLMMKNALVAVGTWTVICVRKPSGDELLRAVEIPADIASRFEVADDIASVPRLRSVAP